MKARAAMKAMAILAGVLLISSAVFAAPGDHGRGTGTTPTTDGAVWGSAGDGAVWGATGASTSTHGNQSDKVVVSGRDLNDRGSMADFVRTLLTNLGIFAEGAIWG